jgi:hypothetical protein
MKTFIIRTYLGCWHMERMYCVQAETATEAEDKLIANTAGDSDAVVREQNNQRYHIEATTEMLEDVEP